MREQFEKLPEIARHIHKFVYQDDLNCYRNKIKSSDIHLVTWVNGAWYAFQEQQAKAQMARDEKLYAINRWTAVCKERDDLKAQLECCRKENAVLLGKVGEGEKRVSELNQWNSNQYELIKRNESHTQSLRHLLQKLIHDDYTTMRPSMAYEIQEILRGEHE